MRAQCEEREFKSEGGSQCSPGFDPIAAKGRGCVMTHAYLPHAHQHLAFKTEEELDGYAPRPFSLLSIDRPPASQRVLSRNGRGTRTDDDGRYIQGIDVMILVL